MYQSGMIQLLRQYNHKLDTALRKHLFSVVRPNKRMPCFLHKPLNELNYRIQKQNVLIQLKHESTVQDYSRFVRKCLHYGEVNQQFHKRNMVCLRVSCAKLFQLVTDQQIEKVYLDRKVQSLLDVASPSIHAPSVWDENWKGSGVTVAVLDTGIDPHPDLAERITGFKDFISEQTEPYDDNGHGTHVAGCVAGDGRASDGAYRGAAPEANVVGVKVLDKVGSGNLSHIISGIEWCIENKDEYDLSILNLSLGAEAVSTCADDPLCQMVEEAWEAGLTVCVAAGNSGPGSGTIASPGISPKVITVGAMDDQNTVDRSDDDVASFSSRGPTIDGHTKPDLLAPGVNITAARVQGSFLDKQVKGEGEYTTMSGTSMAAPICAGVMALMLEANGQLSPDKVKQILMDTAEDWGLDENDQGAGYVDAKRAVDVAVEYSERE